MKVTPMDLSKPPLRIMVDMPEYDVLRQRRTRPNTPLTITANATRTYDNHGRPNDHDSD